MYNSAELQAIIEKRLKDGKLGAYFKLCEATLNEEVKKMIAQRKKDDLGDESAPLTVNHIQALQMMSRIVRTIHDVKATRLADAMEQEIQDILVKQQLDYGKRGPDHGLMNWQTAPVV